MVDNLLVFERLVNLPYMEFISWILFGKNRLLLDLNLFIESIRILFVAFVVLVILVERDYLSSINEFPL